MMMMKPNRKEKVDAYLQFIEDICFDNSWHIRYVLIEQVEEGVESTIVALYIDDATIMPLFDTTYNTVVDDILISTSRVRKPSANSPVWVCYVNFMDLTTI